MKTTISAWLSVLFSTAALTVSAVIVKPTLLLTYPMAGQKLPVAYISARGTAKDKTGVTEVFFQLNGTGWQAASTTNGWTNWSTPELTLSKGINTLQAYAVDTAGNRSLTNKETFTFKPVRLAMTSLSSMSPAPLTSLTIGTSGMTNSDPITAYFTNKAGFFFSTPPIHVGANGKVLVAVPLYVAPGSGKVSGGVVSLVLAQGDNVSAPVAINILNLPPISAYGTKLGQITHSFYIFQAITLGRQLNELEAARLLYPGVDTSASRASLSNRLHGVILARQNVDAIMLDHTLVITNGFLSNGTPVLFDRNALDMMDRVFAVHLTSLTRAIGLAIPVVASAGVMEADEAMMASAGVSSLTDILQFIDTTKGAAEVVEQTQKAAESGSVFNTIQAVTTGANSFLGLALGESASVVSAQVGGILAVVSTVSDVEQMSIDLGFIIKESYFGTGNPEVLEAAYADINNLQTKTFQDSVSTALAAEGLNMAEIGAAATAWQLAGGVASSTLEFGLTTYNLTKSGQDADSYTEALNVASQMAVFPSASQGFGQLTGKAVGGANSGLTAPQSSLDLCCFGAADLGIQGITDASGNFDLFVPLGVPDTDYGSLTLHSGDFISENNWGSETVNLSGLKTSKPVQVPAVPLPLVYYTLDIGTSGNGGGTVSAKPSRQTYVAGTVVTLTAIPDAVSRFVGWSGNAAGVGTTVQIKMNGDKTVTANFTNPNSLAGTWSGTWNWSGPGANGCDFSDGVDFRSK